MICPGCGVPWDPETMPRPVPGEPTVCRLCGMLGVFTDGGVRETTLDEEAAIFDRYPILGVFTAAIRWDVVCRKIVLLQRSRLN